MATKSLYDENAKYTDAASDLDERTTRHLFELFNRYCEDGYSPHEIAHIMIAAITDLELSAILKNTKEDDL